MITRPGSTLPAPVASGAGARLLVGAVLGLAAAGCAATTGATAATPPVTPTSAPIAAPIAPAPTALDEAPPTGDDLRRLRAAVEETDAGQFVEAISTLEDLRRRRPNNAFVIHELALAYRRSKRPEKAVLLLEPLADRLPVVTLASLASALDDSGRSTDAAALLRVAIQRHPGEGLLYSELATTLSRTGNLKEVLGLYLRGIEVEPAFAATYLNLANLLADSPYRGLALVYGETFRVLEPGTPRSEEMATLMGKVCRDAVQITRRNGKTEAHVSLAPSGVATGPSLPASIPLAGAFELKFGVRLVQAHEAGFALASLHKARQGFLDDLQKPDPTFDWSTVPILRWLRALAAAGHLEAYDYWLYGPAFPGEAAPWVDAHGAELEAMARYVTEHPLFPKHP